MLRRGVVVELKAARNLLQYGPRRCPQIHLASPIGSFLLHITVQSPAPQRQYHAWNAKKRSKQTIKAEKKGFEKLRASPVVPDFSLPLPPTREDAVTSLRDAIEQFGRGDLGSESTAISQWGIRGSSVSAVLSDKCPESEPEKLSPRGTIAALKQRWSLEASGYLNGANVICHTFPEFDDVQSLFAAEETRAWPRLCTVSFLRWLESELAARSFNDYVLTHLQSLLAVADIRDLPLHFVEARSMVRQIHLHVGPTNSGKTHGALTALCKANTGLYAGPLRLLAHEVWDRINSGTVSPGIAARPCNLVTGEEVKVSDELAGLTACTVEMISLKRIVDVAVIDEIQMIGDPQRGFAWTTAVLGVPAKELHLCGESSVVPLIEKLAKACGDEVHVHEYERLTPLSIGPSLNGNLRNIQKGDCIVAFSRSEIFRLKELIESTTNFKCALAYGALPPEVKSEQAKIFNNPDNDVSVMVASDAIGMGLNLKIKRIIFSTVQKWNGTEIVSISASQLKQIAGRAGRYGTSKDDSIGGLATTLHPKDLPILKAALDAPLLPITRAAVQPTAGSLERLATLLPPKKKQEHSEKGTVRSLESLFQHLQDLVQIDSNTYFAGDMGHQLTVAPLIEATVPCAIRMTVAEREKFAMAPANLRDERLMALLANMIGYYARGELIRFQKVDASLGMLYTLRRTEAVRASVEEQLGTDRSIGDSSEQAAPTFGQLINENRYRIDIEKMMILESLHRGLTLYLWLSFRFPLSFCYRAEAQEFESRTEKAIEFCLAAIKAARAARLAAMPSEEDRDAHLKGRSKAPLTFHSFHKGKVRSFAKEPIQEVLQRYHKIRKDQEDRFLSEIFLSSQEKQKEVRS